MTDGGVATGGHKDVDPGEHGGGGVVTGLTVSAMHGPAVLEPPSGPHGGGGGVVMVLGVFVGVGGGGGGFVGGSAGGDGSRVGGGGGGACVGVGTCRTGGGGACKWTCI